MFQSTRTQIVLLAGFTLLGTGMAITGFVGCKDRAARAPVASPEDSSKFVQESLISRIPVGSLGFYHWSLKSPAYQRMEQSVWKSASGSAFDPSNASSAVTSSKAFAVFKDAGIDLMDHEQLKQTVDELVVFIAPTSNPTKKDPVEFGALLTARAGVDFESKFGAIRESLANHDIQVSDVTYGAARGFEADVKIEDEAGEQTTKKMFVAYSKSYASLGTSSSIVQATSESLQKGGAVPQAVGDAAFQKLTRSFNRAENRYALGFMDVAKFVAIMEQVDPSNTQWASIPARAAAVESWMAETPGTNAAVSLWPRNEEQKRLLAAINSPASPMLLSVIPAAPMTYISLDGGILSFIKGSVASEQTQGTPAELLDQVNRIVVAIKPAPVGQALLPVPEILIGIETPKSAQLAQTLIELAKSFLPPGAPEMPAIQDRKVGSATVKQIATPLGLTVSVAHLENLVLLSTTDQQLNSSLSGITQKANLFASALSAPQRDLLVSRPTAGALYVDFPQLATFIESIASLMGMYGGGTSTSGVTSPEQLEAMRKRGQLVGAARLQDELLEVNSFYTAASR